jgi:hypothetical protein
VRVDAVDHFAIHLDQPAVRVVGEAFVAGHPRQPLNRFVVEPEIEDRVHHPRHRDRSARAHRNEQRVVRVAEALARALLERLDVALHLFVEPVRERLPVRHVRPAGIRRDREPGGNGHAELGHLR